MRIEYPHRHERFGAVRIHDLVQVIELDSGLRGEPGESVISGRRVVHVPPPAIAEVERRMAIVIPTKNERRKVIEGVLSAVPHDCLVVLVSASERKPIDRYRLETDLLSDLCEATGRRAIAVHQADPGVALALDRGGMPALVGPDDLVRPGKGEAMIVAMLITEATGQHHVGFVDADNYVPGAVHEYAKIFAAGLHMAPTPYAMVRISWQSKPKVTDGRLVFNRWGRSTKVTNEFLNQLLSEYTGFGTDIIKTANAGEHAMTMQLAKRLGFAGGFAIEPYQIVEMFEQFGGALPSSHPEVNESLVDVFQVETRNPHFHEDKGGDHVTAMRTQALHALCGSPVCPPQLRSDIVEFLEQEDDGEAAAGGGGAPYPPIDTADLDSFAVHLAKAQSFQSFGMSMRLGG